jgi:hypothetical protein
MIQLVLSEESDEYDFSKFRFSSESDGNHGRQPDTVHQMHQTNNTMVPKVIDQSVEYSNSCNVPAFVTAIEIARGIFPNNLPYA